MSHSLSCIICCEHMLTYFNGYKLHEEKICSKIEYKMIDTCAAFVQQTGCTFIPLTNYISYASNPFRECCMWSPCIKRKKWQSIATKKGGASQSTWLWMCSFSEFLSNFVHSEHLFGYFFNFVWFYCVVEHNFTYKSTYFRKFQSFEIKNASSKHCHCKRFTRHEWFT